MKTVRAEDGFPNGIEVVGRGGFLNPSEQGA